jgi:uncharacterized protein (TIGR02145 family)
MKLVTLTKLWRTLLLLTAAVSLGLMGCGGDDNPSGGDNNGNNNNNNNNSVANNTCTSGGSCKSKAMPDGKTWLTENLNVETAEGSWCYNGSPDHCKKYGRLYTWSAAKTACQSVGMRLPTREEWGALAKAAGGTGAYGAGGTAGVKLKSKSGWYGNGNGTDDYGFSALPGGTRDTGGRFLNAGYYGNWWTATESSDGNAYYRGMGYDIGTGGVGEGYDGDRGHGISVRCVR